MKEIPKRLMFFAMAVAAVAAFAAAPVAPPDATPNEWAVRRSELMIQVRELESDLDRAWFDPACTSPEIEALRAKSRELEDELVKTRELLKEKILQLPVNSEKRAKADVAKAELNRLTDLINAYLKSKGLKGEMRKIQPESGKQK